MSHTVWATTLLIAGIALVVTHGKESHLSAYLSVYLSVCLSVPLLTAGISLVVVHDKGGQDVCLSVCPASLGGSGVTAFRQEFVTSFIL